jgi:hypothetical protein
MSPVILLIFVEAIAQPSGMTRYFMCAFFSSATDVEFPNLLGNRCSKLEDWQVHRDHYESDHATQYDHDHWFERCG